MPSVRDQLQHSLGQTYAIDREIGRGGMATVYLARDEKHHRNVALKVLDPELGAVLGAERFLSEIRVTAGLQHPNLLPLFDSGEAGGLLYYVMPYIDGESLRHRLEREKQLPIDVATRIAVAIANALEYAHAHGVIHRDLKPENVLLQAGEPVIADFGIALAVSNAGGTRITQTGLSLGTPQYMSPEQATGDRVIDGRTDIYSLAAVTYEMLCGEPPHSGTSAQAIIAKLMTTEPQPVRSLRPSVPPNVAMAVERGLAKLPADRFASAKAFADALTNTTFTTEAKGMPALRAPQSRVAWALGGVSAALLVAAAWGWMRPPEPKQVLRYTIVPDSSEALIAGGRWGRISLSPDGSMLVYVGGPRNELLLRKRDELGAKAIPGTERSGGPVFSPSGRRVAFIQDAKILKIASLDGNPPITVTDSVVGLAGMSWDGEDMLYIDGLGAAPMVRIPAHANATAQHFVSLDTALHEMDQVFPQVLPNGKGVLYNLRRPVGDARGPAVALLDPKTGRRHIVVDAATRAIYAPSGHLVYSTRSGTLLAAPFDLSRGVTTGEATVIAQGLSSDLISIDFAVSRSGALAYIANSNGLDDRELVWVSRDGRAQVVDSVWRGAFADPAIAPDGKRFAISTGGVAGLFVGDIWIRQVASGGMAKLTVNGGFNRYPVWSPDGKTLTYASTVADTFVVVKQPADGSAPAVRRLTATTNVTGLAVTPDDQWVLYTEGPVTTNHLFARRSGDTTRVDLLPSEPVSRLPVLSPDGKWLAYVVVQRGTPYVYVSPFPNPASTKWLVTPRGGSDPAWSPNGSEIVYRTAEPDFIASVSISTLSTFSSGTPKLLFAARDYPGRFAVARDSRLLMIHRVGGVSREQLTVVENWAQGLRRR